MLKKSHNKHQHTHPFIKRKFMPGVSICRHSYIWHQFSNKKIQTCVSKIRFYV